MTRVELEAVPTPQLVERVQSYNFECEAGPLTNCVDWQVLRARALAGVPCPLCGEEAVGCASQGERRWLGCVACKTDFSPELATFQAGFKRGLAEGTPTRQQGFCQHGQRIAYEPESSIGDESDYESRCLDCKKLLRMAPNV